MAGATRRGSWDNQLQRREFDNANKDNAMGFLDALKHVFGDTPARDREQREKLAAAWNVDEDLFDAAPAAHDEDAGAIQGATQYDRRMWSKKLRHLLIEKLPIATAEWHDFLADAHALGFDDAWVAQEQRNAFGDLLRKAVADGVITPDEQHTIDLARRQIGLSDADGERMLKTVLADAERMLGHSVKRS